MRSLSTAVRAAVNAVVTSPGHLVEMMFAPTPARWSDIGSVALPDGRIFTGVDMHVQQIAFIGDAAPAQFSIVVGNLDGAIGALLLDNDIPNVPLYVYGFDRRATEVADLIPFGRFAVLNARIGIDAVDMTCAPFFYTAPFRRVDAYNGFTHATPNGTQIVWGETGIILTRTNEAQYG
jgi:hypothetical protein